MMLLKTEGLGIRFGGLAAVKKVDFEIGTGEIIGLIGPNGSGKSTFFNLITGLYQPTEGEILWRGEDLVGLQPHQIVRKGISRTFQNGRLFPRLSLLDNILAGMTHLQSSNIFDCLFRKRKVNAEMKVLIDKALFLVESFNKEMVERKYQRVRDLPLVDRKRVEICRAIAFKPKLLLLDEPSAGMNSEETSELMQDILKMKERDEEMSIILIEHDMRVIKEIAGRVVVLNYGEKIFEGTFEEASRQQGVKEAYLGIG